MDRRGFLTGLALAPVAAVLPACDVPATEPNKMLVSVANDSHFGDMMTGPTIQEMVDAGTLFDPWRDTTHIIMGDYIHV